MSALRRALARLLGVPGELVTDAAVEAAAEALRRFETSGMCPLRGACEMCDCGMAEASPQKVEDDYRLTLDRARYVLEAAAPLIAARVERPTP